MQKLKLLFIFILLFAGSRLSAQEIYIIEQDTLELQREVKGPLSLFWNEKDHSYRYFVQKGDRMVELRNTREGGAYQEEYKEQLKNLTTDAQVKTGDVLFVLYSLKHFVNRYNAQVQEDYEYNASTSNIKYRLGLFTGISNNKYTENPDNTIAPILGLEFEFFDPNLAPRHAAFIQLRQSFKREDYRYSSTQLSLNYRFRALYFPGFDLHIDTELATLYYSEDNVYIRNDEGEITAIKEEDGFTFTAPFSFGVGTEIKITEASFITLSYNDIVSIALDGNGSFPVDFTVGYKFRL
ncbi:hypothetical protein [Salinimicrobium flavum]|uniref:Outer membrane protein beta-barrel domain-containing protein n=1 Tax=Salinimicrobium flavum TaxID=1737065 RepID=A0ABW5ITM9_9FLAO